MLGRLIAFSLVVGVLAVLVPQYLSAPPAGTELPAVPSPEPSAVSVSVAEAARPGERRAELAADQNGHFTGRIEINGRAVEMMVDTGATVVALNQETARRLGILPSESAFTAEIATANGRVRVAPVRLDDIRIGAIEVRHVDAVVVPGDLLPSNLLGMSFLGRLSRYEVQDRRLVLVE